MQKTFLQEGTVIIFTAFTIGPLTFAFPKFAYYLHHLRTMGPEALVFMVSIYIYM